MVVEEPFSVESLGRNIAVGTLSRSAVIYPGNVRQIAFRLIGECRKMDETEIDGIPLNDNGRITLGQLQTHWRNSMGDRGSLNTGRLMGPQ